MIAGLEAEREVGLLEDEVDGAKIALSLAQKLQCVVAITGKLDMISDGTLCYGNVSPMVTWL